MTDKTLNVKITGVDKLSPKLKGVRKNLATFRKQLYKQGAHRLNLGNLVAGAAFGAPLIHATKAAIGFESAMADVRKVVHLTPQEFNEMGEQIIGMSKRLPIAANDIAKIMAEGAQSGIDKPELAQFAQDAMKLSIAYGNTAEEAGDMMAGWRTAFGLTQKEVFKLADQINYLGLSGTSTPKQIADVVTRVAALGQVAGLSTEKMAALGATFTDIKVPQDVAATAIKNFLLPLTAGTSATKKQRNGFKALRLNVNQLAIDMQRDAQGTIVRVIDAISHVKGSKRGALLNQLFGSESLPPITGLILHLDQLRANFNKVQKAQLYSGSLDREYTSRVNTMSNSIQLLKNRYEGLNTTMGKETFPIVRRLIRASSGLMDSLSEFVTKHPDISRSIVGITGGLVALRAAAFATSAAVTFLTGAFTLLGANPISLALAGIAISLGLVVANWDELAKIKSTPIPAPRLGQHKFNLQTLPPYMRPHVIGEESVPNPFQPEARLHPGFISSADYYSNRAMPLPQIFSNQIKPVVRNQIDINFTNSPTGMRVAPVKQPQKQTDINLRVGYRSLATP